MERLVLRVAVDLSVCICSHAAAIICEASRCLLSYSSVPSTAFSHNPFSGSTRIMASFLASSSENNEVMESKDTSRIGVEPSTSSEGREDNHGSRADEADDESDPESELPFEPFDIHNDGRMIKTTSRCSRGSWKRPEPGYDVAITVHRFRELDSESGVNATDDTADKNVGGAAEPRTDVKPNLQLQFKLRQEDEATAFPQSVCDEASAAGVELHPLLHDAIETMGNNEYATFVVKTNGGDGDVEDSQPRRLEYELSLDGWTEEVDVSEEQDRSLVKRVIRDGDGTTQPVDVGTVNIKCRVTRIYQTGKSDQQTTEGNPEGPKEEVVFDSMQDQDDGDDDGEGADLQGSTEFVLDDCPFGAGVMILVKSMRMGEVCEAWLGPQHVPVATSEEGEFCHRIIVELVGVEELPPVWESQEIRLRMSTRFKSEGNEKFAAGDYKKALRRYANAIRYADGVDAGGSQSDEDGEEDDFESKSSNSNAKTDQIDGNEEQAPATQSTHHAADAKNAFVDMQAAILCNQAACYLKIGDGISAMEAADRASTLKPTTECVTGRKAAYRRACALEVTGEWDESRQEFKRVLDVEPKNISCQQGLVRLARAEKAYRARLKTAFGGCLVSGKLNGFASDNRPPPAEDTKSSPSIPGIGDFGGVGGDEGPWSDGSSYTSEDDSEDGDYEDDSRSSSGSGEDERERENAAATADERGSSDAGGESLSSEKQQQPSSDPATPSADQPTGAADGSSPVGKDELGKEESASSPAGDVPAANRIADAF